MNKIVIRTVAACDAGKAVLSPSPVVAGAYLITVAPLPLGVTGTLYIRISCRMIPGHAGTIHFKLKLLSLADWNFTGPDASNKSEQHYDRITTDDTFEYLDFGLKNLKAAGTTLPASFRIEASDAVAAPPNTAVSNINLSDN